MHSHIHTNARCLHTSKACFSGRSTGTMLHKICSLRLLPDRHVMNNDYQPACTLLCHSQVAVYWQGADGGPRLAGCPRVDGLPLRRHLRRGHRRLLLPLEHHLRQAAGARGRAARGAAAAGRAPNDPALHAEAGAALGIPLGTLAVRLRVKTSCVSACPVQVCALRQGHLYIISALCDS